MTLRTRESGETAPPGSLYRELGVEPLPVVFEPSHLDIIVPYIELLGHNGRLSTEAVQVPDSLVLYGDPLLDSIMDGLTPRISQLVGGRVAPTYSYLRVYLRGQELRPHSDRRSCEHSVTVHLASSEPCAWPVFFTDLHGQDQAVTLEPGDGVAYRGLALTHWRDACPVDWFMQVFLHYVSLDGPHGSYALDRRHSLGVGRVKDVDTP